jgi:hypothetical protein
MRVILKLAVTAVLLYAVDIMLVSGASAQLDSSCQTIAQNNNNFGTISITNPIVSCTFDANRTGVTWLSYATPIPPNSTVLRVDDSEGLISYTPPPAPFDPNSPSSFLNEVYDIQYASSKIEGIVTGQDRFAGFNDFYQGCKFQFLEASTSSTCNTAPTTSVFLSYTDPNPTSADFESNRINLNSTTTCIHNGVTQGWQISGSCTNPPPPNPPFVGSVTYKWTLGQRPPGFSAAAQNKAMSKLGDDLTNVGLAQSVVALGSQTAANPLVGLVIGFGAFFANSAAKVDPPDLNYQTVVTPTPPNVDVSGLPSATAALIQLEEQQIGLLSAIYTTGNRATGAYLAGDPASFQLQVSALPGFEQQNAVVAAQLPAALAAWGQELLSEGFDPRTITVSDVETFQKSLVTNGFPSDELAQLTALGADTDAVAQIQKMLIAADPLSAASVAQNLLNFGPVMPPVLPDAQNLQLFAAVLPVSRAVKTGSAATAFATIINAGSATATACGIAPDTPAPVSFSYQTTDPITNALTGTPNTAVNIPAGGSQSYVISVTPTVGGGGFPPVFVNFVFFCGNANAAPQTDGLDTLLLSSPPGQPADVVALVASGDPGIVDIPGTSGTGAFAVATVNVGSSNAITVTATATTASGATSLPVTINICQTNPQSGQCLAPPAPYVNTQINAGDTPTFAFFVTGSGTVTFDPTNNRVVAAFFDSTGTIRGATSVAVRTQ